MPQNKDFLYNVTELPNGTLQVDHINNFYCVESGLWEGWSPAAQFCFNTAFFGMVLKQTGGVDSNITPEVTDSSWMFALNNAIAENNRGFSA